MPSSLFEIIELPNGDIALQRAGEEGEPVVCIRFSQESLYFLRESKFEVAKAMIEAGLEAASEMTEREESAVDFDIESDSDSQTIH